MSKNSESEKKKLIENDRLFSEYLIKRETEKLKGKK